MAVDPIDAVAGRGGVQQGGPVAPSTYTAGAGNVADTQETGQAGPNGDQLMATKARLDRREEAYRGIVGGERAEGAGGAGGAQGAGGAAGAIADKTGDQVSDEELRRLFGGDADKVRQLLNAKPNVTVGEILPLRKDPEGLDATTKLLTSRSDLNISDVLQKDKDGKVTLNPTVRDEQSRDLMINRNDINPRDLSSMASSFAQQLGNPLMAKQAYTKSLELLKVRTDLRPQDLGQMMTTMGNSVKQGSPGGQQSPQGGAALLDMFSNATDLLSKRTDLHADDMGRLAQSTAESFGSQKDPNSLSNMTNAFSSATKLLESRSGMSVSDVTGMMDGVKERFPGNDAGADRVSAFEQSANLMTQMPNLDARGLDQMWRKAAEGPPPRQGIQLLNAFGSSAGDLTSGRASVETATTDRAQQTDRQVRDEKVQQKDNRIENGRLADPQEQRDTEEGRNDSQGRMPDRPGDGKPADDPGRTQGQSGQVKDVSSPREGALESLGSSTDPAGTGAQRPDDPRLQPQQ